ncbi:hypothetical protein [Altericroceibacterium xinjiangense]|uniref:hypothetical protein n=1 Tax=Altericroceibacterium xinjiangense TaxID=762261 RepID=UPI000F7E96F8|nr:hypothetical protein [Altericroceibacterium xinjiangense]
MAKESNRQAAEEIKHKHKKPGNEPGVPGPSTNPATNLLIADIIMRASSYVVRGTLQKTLLKRRYSEHGAKKIVQGRSISSKLATVALAKMATKSVPGAVLVGGGILAKSIFDRSIKSHKAKRQGDRELAETAKNA